VQMERPWISVWFDMNFSLREQREGPPPPERIGMRGAAAGG